MHALFPLEVRWCNQLQAAGQSSCPGRGVHTDERPPGPAFMPLFFIAKCVMSVDIPLQLLLLLLLLDAASRAASGKQAFYSPCNGCQHMPLRFEGCPCNQCRTGHTMVSPYPTTLLLYHTQEYIACFSH